MPAANRRQPAIGLLVAWIALIAAALFSPSLSPGDDPADLATRQTARVAVLFWALAAAMLLLSRRSIARVLWTLACAAYLVHVATAFDRVHNWSHGAAFNHVHEVSGFGPGIFVSYFFSLLWLIDAAWWWIWPIAYESRPNWLDRLIHAFMAFVVFNGTVVYETGFIRWAGLVVFIVLATLLAFRILGSRKHVAASER
jgi:hypothetical protein